MKRWGLIWGCAAALLIFGLWKIGGEEEKGLEEAVVTTGEPLQEKEAFSLEMIPGATAKDLAVLLGAPMKKDPGRYGYQWWMYKEGEAPILIGMYEGEAVTAVVFHRVKHGDVRVGDSYQTIGRRKTLQRKFPLPSEGPYTFELSEEDVRTRPLLPFEEQWSLQLYIDTVTEKVSAVRLIRNDFLLRQQPYRLVYNGALPAAEYLDREEWEAVQEGEKAQIFALTNYIRKREGADELKEHKEAGAVAYRHSEDMARSDYFSHHSPDGKGLKERLEGISYTRAGENLAARYVDPTAALNGWMNSPGHRKALLDTEFTHVGIGVFRMHYTQNFLTLP
ncbi:CAP-associated domain-containing protein [Halobacillus sp. KGW1]|uniref:CAP domain-containing protein n=1 Tax=Halobacillus sp. KGW1 TaxID=1793726 RepID=UPI00078040B1|nr:CAP-associated domain-containing protein [Halobacillus sp. KGW1]